jgi:superfamily II DNA or RNA helicase
MDFIAKRLPISYADVVKKDLVVSPIETQYTLPQKRTQIHLYKQSDDSFIVPRFWDPEVPNISDDVSIVPKTGPEEEINTEFKGELRENQVSICNDIRHILHENKGVILSLPCGFGKTIIAINLITKLKLKTLVIVNKSFLMNQWKENLEKFSTSKVGMIQQKVIDTQGKDVVIGMLQSLSSRSYPESLFDQFDFVIVDEVHNIATQSFSKALFKIRARYTLGLSATPERKDGLSKVFKWFLGTTVYVLKECKKHSVQIHCHKYRNLSKKEDRLFQSKLLWNGNLNISSMLTNISASESRNLFITRIIASILEDDRRNVLVLSSRISQLENLRQKCTTCPTGMYIGKMKKEELKLAEQAQLIFSTYEMVSEGFDLPKLNCIVFATPRSNVQQSVGRILRRVDPNTKPIIVDICDMDLGVFIGQCNKRMNFYKKHLDVELHNV